MKYNWTSKQPQLVSGPRERTQLNYSNKFNIFAITNEDRKGRLSITQTDKQTTSSDGKATSTCLRETKNDRKYCHRHIIAVAQPTRTNLSNKTIATLLFIISQLNHHILWEKSFINDLITSYWSYDMRYDDGAFIQRFLVDVKSREFFFSQQSMQFKNKHSNAHHLTIKMWQ